MDGCADTSPPGENHKLIELRFKNEFTLDALVFPPHPIGRHQFEVDRGK
jgi:hypothetical protein